MHVYALRGKSIACHVERRLLGQMRMFVLTARIEERAEIVDLNEDVFFRFVCVWQGHGFTAHGVGVTLVVLPHIE